jgi:hypothetical protein
LERNDERDHASDGRLFSAPLPQMWVYDQEQEEGITEPMPAAAFS